MCRRRFFKSYLYIEYGGIKYKNGETVSVSPFLAEGNYTTIVLDSARPWNITNNISWLTVSSSSNKSGTYTITLTAAANQSYDGRSGSFTAKTLDDRYSIVVSVSQQAQAVEYRNLTVSPVSMTLGNDDKFNGKPIQAFVDEYINGSYTRTKEVTTEATWTSQDNSVAVCAAVSNGEVVKPVYGSGHYPDERGTTVTATYLGSAATCNVEVEPQGLDEYRLDVTPTSVVINSDGTQALTVWARYYVDGVYTPSGDELITESSNYEIVETSVPDLISVDDNGVIHGNGVADGGTATIRVSNYPTTGSKYADVEVTVNPTSITYRNLVVSPASMTLDTSDLADGKTIQAYADEYINGTFNRTIEVTSAASWSSQDTSVAACESVSNSEVVKPVYGSGDYPTTRTTTVTTNYMGSAATCTVSVAPEGRVTYLLVVSPTEARIGSNGSTSLTATLQAYVDGVRDSSQDRTVTTSANYNESSNLIEVDSAGHVTGTGQLTGGDAIITVRHQDAPNSVSVTIHVNDAAVDEYLEITPASTSTTWNGQVTYEVFYVREVNGQKTSTKITDASVLRFDLSDGTVGEMNGFVFNAENISTAYTDEEISVTCTAGTYNGFSTRTPAELRVNGASSVAPRLDITAPKYNMASAETMQISATYVIVVNGNDYKPTPLNPTEVRWSENSSYASISNTSSTAGQLTSRNTTNSTQHVTATGIYNSAEFGDVTGYSSDISIARQKENITYGNLRYVTGSNVTVTSVSMAANETDNTWYYLIEDKYDNLVWIDYWDATNYCSYTLYSGNTELASIDKETSGTKYDANGLKIEFQRGSGFKFTSSNTEEKQQKFTLHASETDGEADLSITIAAAQIVRNIDVRVNNKVTSNAGGNCGSLEISWTGLTVGTYIDIIPTNASVAPEVQVTATTGSWTLQNTPTIEANGGGSRSVGVKAQWRENTSINDTEQWTQSGGYVSPQIEVAVKDQISSNAGGNCERLTVSWTALTVGTYIDLESLNADLPVTQILVENATDSVQWNEYPVIGQNQGDARTIAVSATWRSDNDVYDAKSWTQDGNYHPPVIQPKVWIAPDTTTINVQNDCDVQISLEEFTVYIDNAIDFDVTGDTLNVSANDDADFTGNFNKITGNTGYYITASWRGDHQNINTSVLSWDETVNGVTTRKTCTFNDNFEPTTDVYNIEADTELSNFKLTVDAEVTPTYSVRFVCPKLADVIRFTTNGGSERSNGGVTNWTINGFYNGDVISYTATKSGYSDVAGTATVNGADLVINIDFQNESTVPIRLYYTKETNDSKSYVISAKLMTVDNTWSQTLTGQTSTSDNTAKMFTFNVPESKTGKSFTYVFTKIGGDSYDSVEFGGPYFPGVSEDTLSDLNTSIGSTSFSSLDYATLKFEVCYSITGEITLNAENATLDYSSLEIYQDGVSYMTFAGPHGHGDITCAITYDKCIASISSKVYIGGGILDTAKYNNFYIQIYSSKGGTVLYSGPAAGLVKAEGGGISLTPSQLDDSYWLLSTRAINMTTTFANSQSDLPGSIADAYIYPYSSYDDEPLTTIYRIGELGTHSGFLGAGGIDQSVALALGGSITNGAYRQYHLKIVSSTSDIVFDSDLSTIAPQPGYTGDIIPLGYTASRYIENCTWIWTKLY